MMRIDFKYFNEILNLIVPDITPQEIIGRNNVISAAERLTVTLRYLATRETFQSLRLWFRISDRAISYIVKEVWNAIVKPSHSGLHYYNHKHSNWIILMAIAGPSYECFYVDVGTNGRVNEGGVWDKCGFSKALENQ